MGTGEEIWTLTKLGQKRAQDIYGSTSSNPVIAYLWDTGGTPGSSKGSGTASVDEIALHSGRSVSQISASLRSLQRQKLVERVG